MVEETKYLSVVETAKLIRVALKKYFPTQKFSIRSQSYSGGASINVDWENGVSTKEVEAVIKNFEGAGFDGMIDYKYYIGHWMLPDGTITLADSEGCYGSDAKEIAKPCEEAIKIHFGADYVFANRTITKEVYEKFAKEICEQNSLEFKGLDNHPFPKSYDNWYQILWKFLNSKDLNTYLHAKQEDYFLCNDGGELATLCLADVKK